LTNLPKAGTGEQAAHLSPHSGRVRFMRDRREDCHEYTIFTQTRHLPMRNTWMCRYQAGLALLADAHRANLENTMILSHHTTHYPREVAWTLAFVTNTCVACIFMATASVPQFRPPSNQANFAGMGRVNRKHSLRPSTEHKWEHMHGHTHVRTLMETRWRSLCRATTTRMASNRRATPASTTARH
jgi:hypothetical protein